MKNKFAYLIILLVFAFSTLTSCTKKETMPKLAINVETIVNGNAQNSGIPLGTVIGVHIWTTDAATQSWLDGHDLSFTLRTDDDRAALKTAVLTLDQGLYGKRFNTVLQPTDPANYQLYLIASNGQRFSTSVTVGSGTNPCTTCGGNNGNTTVTATWSATSTNVSLTGFQSGGDSVYFSYQERLTDGRVQTMAHQWSYWIPTGISNPGVLLPVNTSGAQLQSGRTYRVLATKDNVTQTSDWEEWNY